MSGGFGKCVEILHVIGDTLYNMDKPPVRPKLGPPTIQNEAPSDREINEISSNVENVNIDEQHIDVVSQEDAQDNVETEKVLEESSKGDVKKEVLDPVQEMDRLLEYCFLKACKTSLKKNDLPMITSTFFKNHVIGACPPGSTVDIKKSSFKKLSVFLAHLKEMGLTATETTKGVETLLSVKVRCFCNIYISLCKS